MIEIHNPVIREIYALSFSNLNHIFVLLSSTYFCPVRATIYLRALRALYHTV